MSLYTSAADCTHPRSGSERSQADSARVDRCRPRAPASTRLPADGRLQVPERSSKARCVVDHEQNAGSQRRSRRAGCPRQSGAHPRRHPVARALARRPGGGISPLLRRSQHRRHVRYLGTSARHVGKGAFSRLRRMRRVSSPVFPPFFRVPKPFARFPLHKLSVATSPTRESPVVATGSTGRSKISITLGICTTKSVFCLTTAAAGTVVDWTFQNLRRSSAKSTRICRLSRCSSCSTSHQSCSTRRTWTWPCPVSFSTIPSLHIPHHSHRCVGTYQTGKRIIRIASFGANLEVFTSKQRPRKLRVYGSDGVEYNFLLKGRLQSRRRAAGNDG